MVRLFHSQQITIQRRRIFFIFSLFVILSAIIIFRLFQLQVVSHSYYLGLAKAQHTVMRKLNPERGKIYVRDKFTDELFSLVINEKKGLVFAIPKEMKNPEEVASSLSPILGIEKEKLLKMISNKNDVYVILARKLEPDKVKKISELNLEGIVTEWEDWRFYPEGRLASSILGFVDFEGKGNYGIEGYFDEELKGAPGFLKAEKDVFGQPVIPVDYQKLEAQKGADIVLTINRDIQYKTEEILEKTIWRHGASGGNAIVMEPKTGKILAMASYPNFDPNRYEKYPISTFSNTNISSVWEPGSIFKPITMASGLDAGKITADETYLDQGSVKVGKGKLIYNALRKAYGWRTMTDILKLSLNCGAVFVEQKLGPQLFYQYLEKFGFGMPFGLELTGELGKNLKPQSEYRKEDLARVAFGQSIAVTPLQMISALSVIANSGKLMRPYIVEEIIHPDDKKEKWTPQVLREVVSPEAARLTAGMMVTVVESGYGWMAKIEGYKLAGKTGTAQVPLPSGEDYDPYKTIGSFVLFGPVEDPQFIILVKIDHPKGVQWAESTAAPAAGEIARFILNYLQIPPKG